MAITLTEEQFKQKYGQSGLSKFEPEKEFSFLGAVKDSAKKRFGEVKQTFKDTASGKITPVETGIQAVGKTAGLFGDIIGAGVRDVVGEKNIEKFAESGIGRGLAEKFAEYEAWADENPRVAKNLESIVNIGDLLLATKGAKSAVTGTKEAVEATGRGIKNTASSIIERGKSFGQKTSEMGQMLKPKTSGMIEGVRQEVGKVGSDLTQEVGKINTTLQDTKEAITGVFSELKRKASKVDVVRKTMIDDMVEEVLNKQPDFTKVKNYIEIAKKAKSSAYQQTPLEYAGNLGKNALDKLGLMKKQFGKRIKDSANKIGDADTGNIIYQARRNFRELVDDRLGGVFTKDGMQSSSGRVLKIDASDAKFLEDIDRMLMKIQTTKTFREVDDLVDKIQGMLYKAQKNIAVPVNDRVVSLSKQLIGELNDGLKGVADNLGETGYRAANEAFSNLVGKYDDLNKALGKDINKGGSLMKRVFSPTDGGTKKLFNEIKELTGIDLIEEAVLAKFVMEKFGDARAASLLEELKILNPNPKGMLLNISKKIGGKLLDVEEAAKETVRKAINR